MVHQQIRFTEHGTESLGRGLQLLVHAATSMPINHQRETRQTRHCAKNGHNYIILTLDTGPQIINF